MNEFYREHELEIARPGQKLLENFCHWHQSLIAQQVFDCAGEQGCPLVCAHERGANIHKSDELYLAPGVTLAQLIDAVGEGRWQALKNDGEVIGPAFERLTKRAECAELVLPAAEDAVCALNRESRNLQQVARLLVDSLCPVADFLGHQTDLTRYGLESLLEQLAPGDVNQGLELYALLRDHFYALKCLNAVRACWTKERTEEKQHNRDLRDLYLMDQAFSAMDPAVSRFKNLQSLRPKKMRSSPHAGNTKMDATCTNTEDAASLIFDSMLGALNPLGFSSCLSDGLLEMLDNLKASHALEAIALTELLVCHFYLSWLSEASRDYTSVKETQRRNIREKLRRLEKKLEKVCDRRV